MPEILALQGRTPEDEGTGERDNDDDDGETSTEPEEERDRDADDDEDEDDEDDKASECPAQIDDKLSDLTVNMFNALRESQCE